MNTSDRSHFKFEEKVRSTFDFLYKLGFDEIKSLPTLVTYQKDDIKIDVYHGRQSFEIGVCISNLESEYTISEIIRAIDPSYAEHFFYDVAKTPDSIYNSLKSIASKVNHYCMDALNGDPYFFSKLKYQRELWSERYALDVLAEQIRPQADEAFRKKDYSKAADLYSRIKKCLSPAELKKLSLSETRRKLNSL